MRNNKNESGRSMTEMLGTLAIIGVLSIGGIAGYSYGMDKYRANQTINDIMLMAVDMITQTSQKRGVPTLAEWGTKTTAGYDFSVEPNPTDATKYGIVVDGVPSRVCQMVGDALKTQATVYVGNAERNDTTASDPCESSDENTMEFYFEPIETAFECEPECSEGEFCLNGICQPGGLPEVSKWLGDNYGGMCSDDNICGQCGRCAQQKCWPISWDHTCTITSTDDGICHWGKCIPKGCDDTTPCKGVNEYCATQNNSCEERFSSGEKGACVTADFKEYIANGTKYYISSTAYISWWDAESACKAINKKMLKAEDLLSDWNKNDRDNDVRNQFTLNENAKSLSNALNGGSLTIWLQESRNTCDAYYVYISNGYVDYAPRTFLSASVGGYTDCYAICK